MQPCLLLFSWGFCCIYKDYHTMKISMHNMPNRISIWMVSKTRPYIAYLWKQNGRHCQGLLFKLVLFQPYVLLISCTHSPISLPLPRHHTCRRPDKQKRHRETLFISALLCFCLSFTVCVPGSYVDTHSTCFLLWYWGDLFHTEMWDTFICLYLTSSLYIKPSIQWIIGTLHKTIVCYSHTQ